MTSGVLVLEEGMWTGRRAFVVGGGPSLRGFPFEVLRDELVIACNRAHECGVADLVVTGDKRWLTRYRLDEEVHPDIPIVYACRDLQAGPVEAGDHVVGCCDVGSWGSTLAEGVSPGDSGIRAANLAAILGADPIYLLGIDMGGGTKGKQEWWHEGYPKRNADWYQSFLEHWNRVFDTGQICSKIYNLSPNSELKCFPFVDWREVL